MIRLRRPMTLTALAALILLSAGAWAQVGASSANGAGSGTSKDGTQQNDVAQMREQQRRRQDELNRRLNFTNEQKQQWVLIQRQTAQQVKAARMDNSLNEEQMQEKIRAIHKQNRVQVLAMLTPEQQDELKKWWEEQRAAKQQQDAKADPSAANISGAAGQGKASAKDDDFFAGMVQDPEPAPKAAKKQ